MPVEEEYTEEERAALAQHGVATGQPAAEQVIEQPVEQPAVQEPAPQLPLEAPAQPERPRDPNTGQFLPAGAAPVADPNAPPVAADPNAPPADPNAPPAPPPGFVPHAALHQERVERQRMAQQYATLQARTNALLAAQNGAAQPAALPDLETDPVGYVRGLEQRLVQFETAQAEERQTRQIDDAILNDERAFEAMVPDYPQASQHYISSRAQELLAFHTPEQAKDIMFAEARQVAKEAWNRGIPSAQLIYQLAQARGYQPGQPQQAPQPVAQPQAPALQIPPVSATAPVYAQPAGGPSPAAVVQAAATGQTQFKTLSVGAGGAQANILNAEALLNMSDEEFEKHLALGTKGANARFAAL